MITWWLKEPFKILTSGRNDLGFLIFSGIGLKVWWEILGLSFCFWIDILWRVDREWDFWADFERKLIDASDWMFIFGRVRVGSNLIC